MEVLLLLFDRVKHKSLIRKESLSCMKTYEHEFLCIYLLERTVFQTKLYKEQVWVMRQLPLNRKQTLLFFELRQSKADIKHQQN